jgi:hypothetical protein
MLGVDGARDGKDVWRKPGEHMDKDAELAVGVLPMTVPSKPHHTADPRSQGPE